MALIRPSMTLVLDLDERLATQDSIQEIKRCYTHIGTPVIRKHTPASDDEPMINTARLLVKFGTRKYLYSADEGADELWNTVVEHWIGSMLHKIGNNMKVFNDRQRKINMPEIVFDHFDIELQGSAFTVSLHPDAWSFVDKELAAQVDLARTLLNEGVLGDAVRIDAPSDEAYEQQRAAAWEVWQQEHPEPEPEPAEQDQNDSDPDAQTDDEVISEDSAATEADTKPSTSERIPEPGDPDYAEWLEKDREAKSYENTAVAPTDSEDLPSVEREEEPEEPERFDFPVDYSLWAVTYADGSKRLFDATTKSYID